MDSGALIAQMRHLAGLTQRDLAERAATSQAMVNRYERRRVEPSISTLERLARCCGQTLVIEVKPTSAGENPLSELLERHRDALGDIVARHRASRPRVFGSVARRQEGKGSDIDLLVDLGPKGTLVDLAAIRREAATLLGVRVDVTTEKMLRDEVRVEALRDAVAL